MKLTTALQSTHRFSISPSDPILLNMFTKVFVVIALGAVAASAGSTTTVNGIDYSCNSGPVQCCGSLQAPTQYNAAAVAGALGLAVQDVTGQLGVQCTPLTGIGAGTGNNCASSPLCCQRNFESQAAGVNCSPATVGA